MKPEYISSRTIRKGLGRLLLVGTVFFATFGAVRAERKSDSTDKEATLICKTVQDGQMSFTLNYDNENNDRVEVILTDRDGNRLFHQVYKDRTLSKTFKVDSDIKSV